MNRTPQDGLTPSENLNRATGTQSPTPPSVHPLDPDEIDRLAAEGKFRALNRRRGRVSISLSEWRASWKRHGPAVQWRVIARALLTDTYCLGGKADD